PQVVFVLPAFEIRGGQQLPRSKEELRGLWLAGAARPFYGALCARCQAPTSYARWWALPPGSGLKVAYEVPWQDPWEPFYLAPALGVPPFDESFLQGPMGAAEQSLGAAPWVLIFSSPPPHPKACELHVAGFRFAVLDGAFVAHRGFKEPGSFHRGREAELELNRQRFRLFRRRLRQRYPSSPRRC
ncbi:B4GA1 glucuronyltransferase, partial [Tricholaema leucomelas]|nr:B4GA1 glucuronyltransferase [Tricholaema leucomelas]